MMKMEIALMAEGMDRGIDQRNQLTDFELLLGLTQPEFVFDRSFGLTPREEQAGRLVCYRLSDAEIAGELHITEATARHHVESVRLKLGVHSRREVLSKATRHHAR